MGGTYVLAGCILVSYRMANADGRSGTLWALGTFIFSIGISSLADVLFGGIGGGIFGNFLGPPVALFSAFIAMTALNWNDE